MANLKQRYVGTVDLAVAEHASDVWALEDVSRVGLQLVQYDDGGTWASGVATIEKSNDGCNWESVATASAAGFTAEIDTRCITHLRLRTSTAESGGSKVYIYGAGWRETP
jgi:allantoicase